MRIATWSLQHVVNDHVLELLPPDYNTIEKITRLDDDIFEQLVKDGTICPSLQRNELWREIICHRGASKCSNPLRGIIAPLSLAEILSPSNFV